MTRDAEVRLIELSQEEDDLELPASPGTSETADDPPSPDYSDLLTPFDDDSLDDAAAEDLIVVTELAEPDDSGTDEAAHDLAVGDVLDLDEESSSSANDEGAGPGEFDASDGITDLGGTDDGTDDGVGPDEPWMSALDEDLPDLDSDAEEGAGDGGLLHELGTVWEDDATAPRSETPWNARRVDGVSACSTVVATKYGVFAAGPAIWRVSASATPIGEAPRHSVSSMALRDDALLYASAVGGLHRIDLATEECRRVAGWHGSADVRPDDAVQLTVAAIPSAWLVRVSNDAVVTGSGAGWARAGDSKTVRVAGDPISLVTTGDDGPELLSFGDDARASRNPSGLERTVASGHTFVAREGDAIAVARIDRGAYLSTDGGATFERLRGAGAVTAIALGRIGGERAVFVATFRQAAGVASILAAATERGELEIIADMRDGGDDDESNRIADLAFDLESGALLAASETGLWRLVPPDSD